jgi:hypothetical protein
MKQKCESHRPKYDLQTGGLKCTICRTLLNDNGEEYKKYTSKEKKMAVDFGVYLYAHNCNVDIKTVDRRIIENDFENFVNPTHQPNKFKVNK